MRDTLRDAIDAKCFSLLPVAIDRLSVVGKTPDQRKRLVAAAQTSVREIYNSSIETGEELDRRWETSHDKLRELSDLFLELAPVQAAYAEVVRRVIAACKEFGAVYPGEPSGPVFQIDKIKARILASLANACPDLPVNAENLPTGLATPLAATCRNLIEGFEKARTEAVAKFVDGIKLDPAAAEG